jgi:hypothetical protein
LEAPYQLIRAYHAEGDSGAANILAGTASKAEAAGPNVVVGENRTGKSHPLRAAYKVAAVSARGEKDSGSLAPTKSRLETAVAEKLRGVFQPDELGRLT